VAAKKAKTLSPRAVTVEKERPLVFRRTCGIDVGKASAMVCTRVPRGRGCTIATWEVTAVMSAVAVLAAELLAAGIEMVVMESTSDYWRIWYYVLEDAGLAVRLVSPDRVRQLKGRPKTDKLDAQWLARLAHWGLLPGSFVPPSPVRALRDLTRARADLIRDRTRCWQRLEKLLEGALIKISSVASKLTTQSARDMIAALTGGERDPRVLAALARGPMKARQAALAQALDGMFQDHHAVLAAQLTAQVKFLDGQIGAIEPQIAGALDAIPAAWGADADGVTGPGAGREPDAAVLPVLDRLDEIPGISRDLAAAIIAETGLDMTRFATPGHLVSYAGLCPVSQHSAKSRKSRKGHGNKYLRGYLGQAANAARNTDTFLGERYARIARRRGPARAQVAVARSILVIIWHLLADRTARYHDLGPGYHAARTSKDKQIRNLIRQLAALGVDIPATAAAAAAA
jgi:transposase